MQSAIWTKYAANWRYRFNEEPAMNEEKNDARCEAMFDYPYCSVSSMTDEQINNALEEGYADMKAGNVIPAQKVFRSIKRNK